MFHALILYMIPWYLTPVEDCYFEPEKWDFEKGCVILCVSYI